MVIYLCNGINVADLVKIKFTQIEDEEIFYIREKTKRTSNVVKEIKITVTSEMQKIIDRWGNKYAPDNYIFQLIEFTDDLILNRNRILDFIKKINNRMKMIGNKLGIGDITTYVARHSFATVLKRSGANISYISESLGHSDLRTTENYLAFFEKEERQKNANLLTGFKNL